MGHRHKKQGTGRQPNNICPCGSGKKYKKCCGVVGTVLKGGCSTKRTIIERLPTDRVVHASRSESTMAMLAISSREALLSSKDEIARRRAIRKEEYGK